MRRTRPAWHRTHVSAHMHPHDCLADAMALPGPATGRRGSVMAMPSGSATDRPGSVQLPTPARGAVTERHTSGLPNGSPPPHAHHSLRVPQRTRTLACRRYRRCRPHPAGGAPSECYVRHARTAGHQRVNDARPDAARPSTDRCRRIESQPAAAARERGRWHTEPEPASEREPTRHG